MEKKKQILIIEDEKKIIRFLELELIHEGFDVKTARESREGLAAFKSGEFDLVLLDIMLPGLSGLEICRRIRKTSGVPVIMLTAKGEITDKVMGLDIGADDYITKPFEIEELLARIRAALRRSDDTNRYDGQEYSIGSLTMNISARRVFRDGREISLTKREFELLEYLIRYKGIVLSRSSLLENVWGWQHDVDTNTVDVYINYLRKKVDAPFEKKLIETVRGFGYTIRDADG